MFNRLIIYVLCLLSLAACIKNDIPYPVVEAQILAFEVEGQRSAPNAQNKGAIINNKDREVTVFVNDTVDLSKLKVTKFEVTDGSKILVPGNLDFPKVGFTSTPNSGNPVVDFRHPVSFVLSIYQDYKWTVTIHQVIKRAVEVVNQVGAAVVDVEDRKVVIYVDEKQPLDHIQVKTMNLGGESGKVIPEPTEVTDFTDVVKFSVYPAWANEPEEWSVYVYQTSANKETEVKVFPMVTSAQISGNLEKSESPVVQYRKQKTEKWMSVEKVTVEGWYFKADVKGLEAGTVYECRVNVGKNEGKTQVFRTNEAVPLVNGSFDSWHLEKDKIWNPWSADVSSFWDTGNDGACVVGKSNSVPTSDETVDGHGKAAKLETIDMFGYLAAGNLFTGEYLRTEVPNGVLNFGRPFNSFPTKLKINYKYSSQVITKVKSPFEALKGQPDSCFIYIALTDWDKPLEIRTDPKKRQLFDKKDPAIIAYAEYVQGSTDQTWQTKELVLNYRKYEQPKHILIVASASKYGDYFTGGPGSKLLVDNFELIYD